MGELLSSEGRFAMLDELKVALLRKKK